MLLINQDEWHCAASTPTATASLTQYARTKIMSHSFGNSPESAMVHLTLSMKNKAYYLLPLQCQGTCSLCVQHQNTQFVLDLHWKVLKMSKLGDLGANDTWTRREYFPLHLKRFSAVSILLMSFSYLWEIARSYSVICKHFTKMKTNLSKWSILHILYQLNSSSKTFIGFS